MTPTGDAVLVGASFDSHAVHSQLRFCVGEDACGPVATYVRAMLLFALLWATTLSAFAQDDAEEFLLADLGVRIDLPDGTWRMTRWSDYDFKAEYASPTGTMLLFAWATPLQIPVSDPEGWTATYETKLEELQGLDPKIVKAETENVGGRPVALIDAAFTFGEGGLEGLLYGATLEIAGQNLHLATVSGKQNARELGKQRTVILDKLDVRTAPLRGKFGSSVEASGITTTLPKAWRPPFDPEFPHVVTPAIKQLGLPDLEGCWTAIRPAAGIDVGVMITCQGGLQLGVVDEHSFEAADVVVRETIFGSVPVEPATPIDVGDRLGFVYAPREGLAVGIVPYDRRVSRPWVLNAPDPAADLAAALEGSTFSGPHPASPVDQATYWLVHRTTSPLVLGPLALIVLVLGGGIAFLASRGGSRSRYADFDED